MAESETDRTLFQRRTTLWFALGISVLVFWMVRSFLAPLLLAALFSAILSPVFRRLARGFGGRERLASGVTVLVFFLLIVGPLAGLAGMVTMQALRVSEEALPWIQAHSSEAELAKLDAELREKHPTLGRLLPSHENVVASLGRAAGELGSYLVGALSDVTAGAAAFLLRAFVMFYAMFYFLKDGPRFLDWFRSLIPLAAEDKGRVLGRFESVTRATLKGTFLIGVIQGALGGIALYVAGFRDAAFWGTVMFVLSVIPGIGTALVWIPVVIYQFVEGHTLSAILLTAWFAGVVSTVDNILRPILVGRDAEMPDLLILVGTLGGLLVFGASGLIIGPLLCAVFVTAWDIYRVAYQDLLDESPDLLMKGKAEEGVT